MIIDFSNPELEKSIFLAEFGLEKECLRVDSSGFLSHTPHPFGDNKNIQRDFCENQTEFITDVFNSPKEVCRQLYQLHAEAYGKLDGEYLWPFSNPPYVRGESDVPVARFDGVLSSKTQYRNYLAEKYGKMKMLYSGIHMNFSFPDTLLRASFKQSGSEDYIQYRNDVYLSLAKALTGYAWFVVYLTAASPVADGSFFKDEALGKSVVTGYSSCRCSEIGYWNDFEPVLSYGSIDEYIGSIEAYTNKKLLSSPSELYYPVRIKPRGDNTFENLRANGINHIELRVLDDNPLSPIGIFEEDIEFIHLLIIYLMSEEGQLYADENLARAVKNEKSAALTDDSTNILFCGRTDTVRRQALAVFDRLSAFFDKHENAPEIIARLRERAVNPKQRYSSIITERFSDKYVEKGLELAKEYSRQFSKKADME